MGRDISANRMSEILKVLCLKEYIASQAKGLDSLIDSGGRRLPRSVIQKLLIARIIINKPKLLLLEDPLQFVQNEEKIKIIDYLMNSERDWTLIVISDFYYWKEKSTQTINLTHK